jgi:50S ribosomal subunit-associated GTPase HflX
MAHPSEVRPATILVDVQLQKTPAEEHDASLQELRQLIETLRWDIVGTLTQKLQSPTAASLIGPGKLEELRASAPQGRKRGIRSRTNPQTSQKH